MHGAIGDFAGGVLTTLGAIPVIPDAIVNDLLSSLENSDDLIGRIRDNVSEAELLVEALLEEEGEDSALVNN